MLTLGRAATTDDLHSARHTIKNNELSRRHSFSTGDKCSIDKEITGIYNSPASLKRSEASSNLAFSKIEHENCKATDINPGNYVDSGSAERLPINNLGMPIDLTIGRSATTDDLHSARHIIENNELSRRHSFSAGDKCSIHKEIAGIYNSPASLKRSEAFSNLALSKIESEELYNLSFSKIEYENCKATDINAENYVYSGSAKRFPINNLGMSIDNTGHLILIKGKSHDLFGGMYKKCTSGYAYKTAQVINKQSDIKFKALYIDDDGQLVGIERNTDKGYRIEISSTEIDNKSDEQFITVDFAEYTQTNKLNDLTFKIGKDLSASYFTQDGKLYFKSIQIGGKSLDYSCLLEEIKIPMPTGYSVSHIKKTNGVLQVETQKGSKKRIIYINPHHISYKNSYVKKTSHKPPQNFSSRVGNDPHEKYHAGQPFTSDRVGNFSSKYIPFFSQIVDKVRVEAKYTKENIIDGNTASALLHSAKIVDPLIAGFASTGIGLVKSVPKTLINKINTKEDLYDHNVSLLKSRSKPLSKVVNEALGAKPEQIFSTSLINLIDEIKPRDTLHLTTSNSIGAFFGIAVGGTPFVPGWFAGVVGQLSDTHDMAMSKTETGNIRVSFNNRLSGGVTALVGTGQGLERTLVKAGNVDVLTIMPFEANALITVQSLLGNNFSFEMSEDHFKEFATQFSSPQKSTQLQTIISKAEAEKIKEKEFVVKIEAKSELRLQAGQLVNPDTYMVMPRTAVGLRAAIELLKVKSSESEAAAKERDDFSPSKKNLKVTALSTEGAIFTEAKIMPIAMQGGGSDTLWCYPLPVVEEGSSILEYNSKPLATYEKTKDFIPPTISDNDIATMNNIDKIQSTPIVITVDNKKSKKWLKFKNIQSTNKKMGLVNDTLHQLRKTLDNQQRSSQNKSCAVGVISHYEKVEDPSFSSINEIPDQLAEKNTSETKFYRLKKMELRRHGSLQHVDATFPIPLFSAKSIQGVTYDQFLGEIAFQYDKDNDLSPSNVKRKILTLY